MLLADGSTSPSLALLKDRQAKNDGGFPRSVTILSNTAGRMLLRFGGHVSLMLDGALSPDSGPAELRRL